VLARFDALQPGPNRATIFGFSLATPVRRPGGFYP
jgi:hypothetical protein